jgi:short-subunit dehydrogenase involved in D-alanine esterification of teichoic acids
MRHQLADTSRVSVVEVSPPCLETRHDTARHVQSALVDADVFAHSVYTQLIMGRTEIAYQTDGRVPHNK